MSVNEIRSAGYLSGLLTMIAASGIYWLLTSAAGTQASTARELAVWAQVIVTGLPAILFWRRAGRAAVRAESLSA